MTDAGVLADAAAAAGLDRAKAVEVLAGDLLRRRGAGGRGAVGLARDQFGVPGRGGGGEVADLGRPAGLQVFVKRRCGGWRGRGDQPCFRHPPASVQGRGTRRARRSANSVADAAAKSAREAVAFGFAGPSSAPLSGLPE